jgi:hypothetical protein
MQTDEDIIRKRIEIRDYIEKKQKDFEESLVPYNKAAQALEGEITRRMLEQGQESIKTDAGTAYRTTVLTTKIADRDLFLDFVFKTNNCSFIVNAAVKEAVKEYMENNNNSTPPGVDIAYIHKTNFRKPA